MLRRYNASTRKTVTAAVMAAVSLSWACAQVPQAQSAPPDQQPVPLVSGFCPIVSTLGVVSLDWNPGFDHPGAVVGLKSFRLFFQPLREDGVNANSAGRILLGTEIGAKVTDAGNGYFHIEARLPHIFRTVRPGTYQLVEAHAAPDILPGYQGEEPTATVFPVHDHLCMKVVPKPPVADSSPSAPAAALQ